MKKQLDMDKIARGLGITRDARPAPDARELDMDKMARALGAERRGKVRAGGGYFGALGLLADVQARFRVPAGGGRPTDPRWTERRLVPFAPETLRRLAALAAKARARGGVSLEPMQLAALLLERTAAQISDEDVGEMLGPKRAG